MHVDARMRQPQPQPLCCCLALLAIVLAASAAPVELSSSALMFYNGDLAPDAALGGSSPCELYVKRAASHGGARIQLVPTHYWVDVTNPKQDPSQCHPDNWADTNLAVKHYCYKQAWDSDCSAFTPAAIAAFTAGLRQCFSTALSLFDEVLIAPHLDPLGDTSKRPKWRNMLRFDPLAKDENGYSYNDIMLQPILAAANGAFRQAGKTFHFAVQGEMGGTVVNHPGSYLAIIDGVRRDWSGPATLRTGVTFFHAFTPGQLNRGPGPAAPLNSGAMGRHEGGYGPLLPLSQWPGVARIRQVQPQLRRLFAAVDFVGVSNYARAGATPQPADLEAPTAILLQELAAMGIDVAPFQTRGSGKHLIWNEFGLGGGVGACNNVSGSGPADLGLFPWLGISGAYSRAADPFKRSPEAAAHLKSYYDAALKVLAAGGISQKVDAAFIWSVASWDVQGVHTASAEWNTSVAQGAWPVERGYADAAVSAAIRAHNAKARS